MNIRLTTVAAFGTIAVLACAPEAPAPAPDADLAGAPPGYVKTAPLFAELGDHHHEISTDVALAQRFFNQGLTLAWGFNHAEAARSFREAQKLDPEAAMAYWGEALVLGPNINAPMDPADVPTAWTAILKAQELAAGVSERERDYIAALAHRYGPEPVEDRSELDAAYADAMRELAAAYPDDLDAQALFAEALMDTTPWDYWLENDEPKPITVEILDTLETVLAGNENHIGANHLYIHAVEAVQPQRGEAAADRLGPLAPDAGHLVHMPSHIYIRVGRYADAATANEKAIAADDSYLAQCHAQGVYPLGYVPHNHHFLWYAAAMEGRAEAALSAAHHTSGHVDQELMREPGYGTLQHFFILPAYARVRFGLWEEILADPAPPEDLKYPTGVWHYARGTALARTGRLDEAQTELDKLAVLAADEELDAVTLWDINTTRHLLQIAEAVLGGELAAARGDMAAAVTELQRGVELEEDLSYDEPAPWHASVRLNLGAVLLEAGRPAEAEIAFREDLLRYPANGWALIGLAQALTDQGKDAAAAQARADFEAAWSRADTPLTGARI